VAEKVAEETIRETKDRLLEGLTDTQKRMGALPDVKAAEDWAVPILMQEVAKVEEERERGLLAKPAAQPAPDEVRKIDEDTTFVRRTIGTFKIDWKTGQVEAQGPIRLRQRQGPPPGEQQLLDQRLALLQRYPEWRKRVMEAWFSDANQSNAADKVLAVLEDSNRLFGDWRFPRPTAETLIFGPRGK